MYMYILLERKKTIYKKQFFSASTRQGFKNLRALWRPEQPSAYVAMCITLLGAATTKYYRLSGSTNRNPLSHSSGSQRSKIKV